MPPAAKQTARYERRREEILDAAAPLFNARGLNGASIADVAGAVGLTPTSITYYFPRRDDLAAACAHRALAATEALLAEAEAAPTAAERLRLFLRLYFDRLQAVAEGRAPAMINFWDLRAMTGPQGQAAAEAFVALFRRFRRLFADPEGPVFPKAERNSRAHLLFSAVLYSKEWVRRYEPDDYPRAAERFADVLTCGLATAGSAWAPPRLALPHDAADEGSREAFLRAATELVNEQGYRGASVDRISAKLQVTKGSFYHHHETKAELVAQCFERTFAVTREAHRAAALAPGDGWAKLCALAEALVRFQLGARGPLLRYSAMAALPEAMRPSLMADFARQSERTAGMIADAIADGSVRPVDPAIAGRFLAGMINAAAELAKWSPGLAENTAGDLFVRPALLGLFRSGPWMSEKRP